MHCELSRGKSLIIKALSLFLMVAAHVCWSDTTGIFSLQFGRFTIAFILYLLGKLCVYIFALLTGYGLYYFLNKKGNKTFKNRVISISKKILSFLCGWWIILFTIFVPLYAISGSWSWKEFAFSLIGYGKINHYSWYVYFYLSILLIVPLADYFLRKSKLVPPILIIVLYIIYPFIFNLNGMVFTTIKYGITLYTSVLLGYWFAQGQYMEKLSNLFKNKKLIVIMTSTILFITIFNYYSIEENRLFMPFLSLFFVITFNFLFSYNVPKFIFKPLEFVGKISMYIWLIHGVVFNDYCNKVLNLKYYFFSAKEAVTIVLLIIILSIPLALFYSFIHKQINKLIYKNYLK